MGTGSGLRRFIMPRLAVLLLGIALLAGLFGLLGLAAVGGQPAFPWAGLAQAQTTAVDYDTDDDGLIEVDSLAQLNAIRWDPDGNGSIFTNDIANYELAFPSRASGMGCPSTCNGYELLTDLDLDTNGNGSADAGDTYWNDGAGWAPIGADSSSITNFKATFDGNGHTIANLYINRSASDENIGLFEYVTGNGRIRNIGLSGVDITASGENSRVGGLVGAVRSTDVNITDSYVTGTISHSGGGTEAYAGGLVGESGGNHIRASYTDVTLSFTSTAVTGGLVGRNAFGGLIIASYARGSGSGAGGGSYGGLVGTADSGSSFINNYWDQTTSGVTTGAGGVGKTTSELQAPTGYTGIYADWNISADGVSGNDDPWQFGSSDQYPALSWEVRVPGKPDSLSAKAGNAQAILTWDAQDNPSITHYEYSSDNGANWMAIAGSGATTVTHTVTGLTPGTAYTFQVRAVSAAGDGPASDSVTATPFIDYDTDDDGLIDVSNLAQLNAIRWDPDGDGVASTGNETNHAAAFPNPVAGLGCPEKDGTDPVEYVCAGYELMANLDFDTDDNGKTDETGDTYWNNGSGWDPSDYIATFEGNGHTIANLFVSRSDGGLFKILESGAHVRNLGLVDVDVTTTSSGNAGGLAGEAQAGSSVTASYSTGRVEASGLTGSIGGLVGSLGGDIIASYSTAAVTPNVTGTVAAGGLVGDSSSGKITASYATGSVGSKTSKAGGLLGDGAGATITDSYWDTETTGQSTSSGGGAGKTTSELQSPTGYTDIYANWDVDLDGDGTNDDPWQFRTPSDYPKLFWEHDSYDLDQDGLIEVSSLAQLNAIRWDPDGDGAARSGNETDYAAAFPNAAANMGCKDAACAGYEMTTDLDFDTNGNDRADAGDAYWNDGKGWTPIGINGVGYELTAEFDGNGHTIANLYINRTSGSGESSSLFGYVLGGGSIHNIGLLDVDITEGASGSYVGGLAGWVNGSSVTITSSYVTGTISSAGGSTAYTGGLVGQNVGVIKASYTDVTLSGTSHSGGLVGRDTGGQIIASYARGSGSGSYGGLVGAPHGVVSNSYWDTTTSGKTTGVGVGKTTAELQAPTGYGSGDSIYAAWNLDLDGDGDNNDDDPWQFGGGSQYPALSWEARAPGKPDNFSATAGDTQVTLTWDSQDTPTITGYEYSSDNGANWAAITGSDATTVTHIVTGLTNGTAYTFRVRAVSAAGNGDASDSVSATPFTPIDYDTDDDGLIEVASLAQLNAIRWDPDGDGAARSGGETIYPAAFPEAAAGMGCPEKAGTDPVEYACAGYELTTNLDFDTNDNGKADAGDAYWNNGAGWEPVGTVAAGFDAVFEGNDHTISNLYVKSSSKSGLFGGLHSGASIRNLGLVNVDVTCSCNATGGLTGQANSGGSITASYITGSVKSTGSSAIIGGLVGSNAGNITASYSTATVTATQGSAFAGGLVAYSTAGKIIASYATGRVTADNATFVGGLVAFKTGGTITNSYWDTTTSGQSASAGGTGKTKDELRSPTDYTGIYTNWDDLDGDGTTDTDLLWQFGGNNQYPRLSWQPEPVPGKPTGLTAAPGDAEVTLTWDDPSNSSITRYDVSSDDGGTWTAVPSSDATTVTYTVTGLDDGTAYTFRVRAVNDTGAGAASDSVTATPMASAPSLVISETEVTVTEAAGAGRTADYTVKLATLPSADVTVTVTSNDMGVATVSPASLTFTTSNYATVQTVTVTGVNDDIINPGGLREATITHTATGHADATVTVTVTVTDDDGPAIVVSKATVAVSEDGATTDTYTVKLKAQPPFNAAQITVTSGNPTAAKVSTGSETPAATLTLIFTPLNWETEQEVTVTAVSDNIHNPNYQRTVTLAHTSRDYASAYVTVTVEDDESSISLSTKDVMVDEDGGVATYTVELGEEPLADVTVAVTRSVSKAMTVSPETLTFTAANWNVAQDVTVTGVNDDKHNSGDKRVAFIYHTADGHITVIARVVVTDDDAQPAVPAGLTASAGSTEIVLTWTDPSDDSISSYEYRQGTKETENSDEITWGAWGAISGSGDTTTTHTVTGLTNGTEYAFQVRAENALGKGAESAAITATPAPAASAVLTFTPDSVTVTEAEGAGGTATYTIALATQPSADVTVTVTSDDRDVALVSPGPIFSPVELTFTTSDWDTAQTVTVIGVDNDYVDPVALTTTISHNAIGGDYGGVTGSVSVTLTDDDVPSILVGDSNPTVEDEDGGTDSYYVSLNALPTGEVTITVVSGDTSIATVAPASLTFTTANWETEQKVTVTGVNDDIVNPGGERDATITHTAIGYATVEITATVVDGDLSILLSKPAVTVAEAAGTAQYTVSVSDLPGFDDVVITLASSDETTATVSPATLTFTTNNWNTAQTVTVTGVNDDEDNPGDKRTATITHTGTSYATATLTVTVTDDDATVALPAKPTGLTATAGDTEVTLTWDDPSDSSITSYESRHKKSSASDWGDWAAITGSGATTVTATVTGLTNGTAYDFQVRAVNATGDGPASDSATATPMASATTPAKPSGFTATAGGTVVTLTWNDPSNSSITSYESRHKKSSASEWGDWAAITGSGAATITATVTGLTNGTAYTFQVRAMNATGNGDASDSATATPLRAKPAAPTGLTATAGDAEVTLNWTDPSDPSIIGYSYRVDGGTWTAISGSGATTTTVTGLSNGTAYTFQVRAVNGGGYSDASNSATATPMLSAPAKPTGLTAAAGDGQVKLTWANPNNSSITSYDYRQSTDGGTNWMPDWTAIANSGASTDTHTVMSLTNGTAYTFQVRAVNATGAGAASDSATATPTAPVAPAKPTGLTAAAGNAQVKLTWTNPSDSSITSYDYSSDGGTNWTAVPSSGATTVTYTATSLTNDTAYTFQVQAVNIAGAGPASDSASATPAAPVAPAKPTGLTAEAGNRNVHLKWTNPNTPDITGYQYQQGTKETEGNDTITWGNWTSITNATDDIKNIQGLTNGTTYYFQLRARNGVTLGPVSDTASATPIPGASASLEFTALYSFPLLVLEDPDDEFHIDSYDVRLAAQPTGDVTVTVTSGDTGAATVDKTTLTFTQANYRTAQTVTVTAVDDDIDNDGRTTSISHTASGGGYDDVTGSVAVEVTDDDPEPTATLKLTPDSITENGGVSTVTASLNHASSAVTTLTVSATPVSPAVAGDFTLSSTTLTIAAGDTDSSGTAVTITAVNNSVNAPDKTVTVSATASNSQGVTAPENAILTITDVAATAPAALVFLKAWPGDTKVTLTLSPAS